MSYSYSDQSENESDCENMQPKFIYVIEKDYYELYRVIGAYIDIDEMIKDFNEFKYYATYLEQMEHNESVDIDNYVISKYNTNSYDVPY